MKFQTLIQFIALFFTISINSTAHSQILNDNCIPSNALINWSDVKFHHIPQWEFHDIPHLLLV